MGDHHRRPPRAWEQRISRRRLLEAGGATAGIAAFLAACSSAEPPAAGRVGNAPVPTDLPTVELNDVVHLRTMSSLEYSIIEAYGVLSGLDGLGDETAAALDRFSADHTAVAETLSGLTVDEGGEPFECANDWMMDRQIQPALDRIVGAPAAGANAEISPTDDVERDTLAVVNGLETLATATYQVMVENLSTPALRGAVIVFGAGSARRAASIAIVAGGDESRFVSPSVIGDEAVPDADGFIPAYAIPSRFGQLTPINVVLGPQDDLGLRYTATFETPADNAFRYDGDTCAE